MKNILLILLLASSLLTHASAGKKKKGPLLFFPVKAKIDLSLPPSSQPQVVEFLEYYFDNNNWNFNDLDFEHTSPGRRDVFEIFSVEPLGDRNVFKGYELVLKKKKKRLRMKLKMTAALVKYEWERNNDPRTPGPKLTYRKLREKLKAKLLERLQDIASYWLVD